MRNNTSLKGVNVSTETDDACEGPGKPECSNKCASSALQAMEALEVVRQFKHKHHELAQLSDGMSNPVCTSLQQLYASIPKYHCICPCHSKASSVSFASLFTVTAKNFHSWWWCQGHHLIKPLQSGVTLSGYRTCQCMWLCLSSKQTVYLKKDNALSLVVTS